MAANVAQLRPDIDPLAALDPVLLHSLTAHSHEVVSIVDRLGRVLFSGGAIERIFGYQPGERLGHSVVDIVHPEDLDYARMRLQQLLSDPEGAGDDAVAVRIRNKAGDYLHCEITGMPLRHAGSTALVVLHTRDVTAQARALARSAVAEVRLETVFRGADIGLWEFDADSGIMTRTEDWFERHDLPPLVAGRPGPQWYDRIHPDDIERVRAAAAARRARGDGPNRLQYRIRARSGHWVWLSEQASVISRNPDGSARLLAGVCLCLDEVKQLEAELELMQERLRLAVEASGMALWDWRVAERVVYRSASWDTLMRTEPASRDPWSLRPTASRETFHPDDVPLAAEALQDLESGRSDILEYEARRLCGDGGWRWMRTRGKAVERAPDGRPLRIVGCTTDVHERRMAEARLAESERRFRTASQLGHEHIAEFAVEDDGELRLVWTSDGLPAALGCSAEEFAAHCSSGRFVCPDGLEHFLENRRAVLSGNSREFATRLLGLDGRIVPVKMVCQPIALRPDGRVARLLSTVLELPLAAEGPGMPGAPSSGLAALQQTMIEYVPACLVLLDAGRRIRFANRSLKQHLPDAAVGRELEDCFQPQWRPIVSAAINRSRDERRSVEVEGLAPAAVRMAGRSYRLHVAPVSSRGAFEGWCVVVRDVTQARNAETDAFNAIGRDPQRIGHELHDGVGQQLTGAVLLMQSLVSGLAAEQHRLAPDAEHVQGLINQSIDDVRMLARSLSPVGTAPTGLPAAMQSLAMRARALGRLTVDLSTVVEPGHSLSAVEGDHLYWIAQEAVTNAIRHSAAAHLEINLEVSGGRFWLRVRDDGRGLAAAADAASGSGSGIKLMAHRARGLGATFTLTPDSAGGTLMTCARAGRQ
jgi:PAS domain S-box-containing protein